MILNRSSLPHIRNPKIRLPDAKVFGLPEKIMQFGSGVLLQGLVDYFIDKANNDGLFNGRVVIVKSTSGGDAAAFNRQDGLFTHCIRGLKKGEKIEENFVNASISRLIDAKTEWQHVLACARNRELQIIVSNTTEVGLVLEKEDISKNPPHNFPGKLLAFLYERYRLMGKEPETGFVIIPTELIPDNARVLKSILTELAEWNKLESGFMEWLNHSNTFCSSLVDRIVPGKPDKVSLDELEMDFNYKDDLLILSEAYSLWAIEGDEKVRRLLSFAGADKGVVIAPDISKFRELKLRMLNATHTFSCGLAFLAGFSTVKQAMEDPGMEKWMERLMMDEIARSIPMEIDPEEIKEFGRSVLDRFRNPFIRHAWLSITLQYSSKMRMRCIPLLLNYEKRFGKIPRDMAMGLAAYISFMLPVFRSGENYLGRTNDGEYPIRDDQAAWFCDLGNGIDFEKKISRVLGEISLWGCDLNQLAGLTHAVLENMQRFNREGYRKAIHLSLSKTGFLS